MQLAVLGLYGIEQLYPAIVPDHVVLDREDGCVLRKQRQRLARRFSLR